METGIELINQERKRQLEVLGHDSTRKEDAGLYCANQLPHAAVAYIMEDPEEYWPWNWSTLYKPSTRVRDLVKAGAMIAAEIDRLLSVGQ